MRSKFWSLSSRGSSLIEVIISATVGVLVVTALTFATIFSIRNANFAKNSAQATKFAQEGLEWVRSGRDKNECIINLDSSVQSWNGGNSLCAGGSIWDFQIKGAVPGKCENTTIENHRCYFIVNSAGQMNHTGSWNTFPSVYQGVPAGHPNPFKRVVTLSDDANYTEQKTATVIVQWTDFSGDHESRLSTILRRK